MWVTSGFGEEASWLPVRSFLALVRDLPLIVRGLTLTVRSTFQVVRSFQQGVRSSRQGVRSLACRDHNDMTRDFDKRLLLLRCLARGVR